MTAITVSTGALRAALLFAGKKDVRAYLNGLHVKPGAAGALIESTDGHRMIQIAGACDGQISAPVILARDGVERACKLAAKNKTVALSIEGAEASIAVAGITVPLELVEARFPDTGLYFSPEREIHPLRGIPFNGDYIADIGGAAKLLRVPYQAIVLDGQRDDALYASVKADAIRAGIVIMRLRLGARDGQPEPGYWPGPATAEPEMERAA